MSVREKAKVIRDPIHDIIQVDGKILELLDTRPVQRLRRIRQLGTAWFVYPSAEHSRFAHSLGVYHIASKMVDTIGEKGDKEVIEMAALLHDVGHMAFSHTFENVIKDLGGEFKHEDFSMKIIQEDKEINKIISKSQKEAICKILSKEYRNGLAVAIISSQLDADRLDFLLRDSYMTGAGYGDIDLPWLLRNMVVAKTQASAADTKKVIAVDGEKALNVLEQYVLGRFYMYKHVYLHKVVRGFETIIKSIFKRFFYLNDKTLQGYAILYKFKRGTVSLEEFLFVDDSLIMAYFKEWNKSTKDKILKDLTGRFLNRRPFKKYVPSKIPERYSGEKERFRSSIEKKYGKGSADFYLLIDEAQASSYKDLFHIENMTQEIFVCKKRGALAESLTSLVDASIIDSNRNCLKYFETRWYVPEDVI